MNIAINHALFQCLNICWITRKGFEHAAFRLVFKYLPCDPSNVLTLKTMVGPYNHLFFLHSFFSMSWSPHSLCLWISLRPEVRPSYPMPRHMWRFCSGIYNLEKQEINCLFCGYLTFKSIIFHGSAVAKW